jgi:selenocysteine lyase/cysteine desulfurase
MTSLDLDFVRAQFPAFFEPSLADFVHLENAGGSYACRQTIDRLDRYYRSTKVQPYYPAGPSRAAGEQMDAAKQRLAGWLNVDSDELQFGPSTTQNSYVVAQALRESMRAGDEIVVTNQDHEANIGAWRRLETSGITVREWRVDPESGELDPAQLEPLLNGRWRAWRLRGGSRPEGPCSPSSRITWPPCARIRRRSPTCGRERIFSTCRRPACCRR